MSAYLRIYGDNDDTPCVCSSPFQRFTVSLSEASEPLGGGRGRCNFRALGGGRGSCNSCELYLMIMPSSPFCESRGPRMLMYKFGTLQSLRYDGFPALPLTVHQVGRASLAVSRMHLLSCHGSCRICVHIEPFPNFSNLFEDLGLSASFMLYVGVTGSVMGPIYSIYIYIIYMYYI